jgi:SAM-dependent methyltransferase
LWVGHPSWLCRDFCGLDNMRKITVKRRAPIWLDAQAPLGEWYASRLGQSILDELENALGKRLGDVFGYQGLQIGNPAPDRALLRGAGLQRLLTLGAPGVAGAGADIATDVTALPIASDSVKAVLFFHTLDFCAHPHHALREADRVLTDDGHLLIVGFNPFSTFGLRHLATGWRAREPWNGQFWSRRRVADWLSVLDYRVLGSDPLFARPPIDSERLLRRLQRVERWSPVVGAVGGLYLIQARKQSVPMSLLRRPWLRASTGPRVRAATGGFANVGSAGRSASDVVKLDNFRGRESE